MVWKSFRWFLILIAVSGVVAQFSPARAQNVCDPGADALVTGQTRYAAGDYAGAVDAFSCAIQQNSTNYNAYLGRFQAAVLAGRYGMAVNDANMVKDFASGLFQSTLADYTMRLSMDGSDVQTLMLRATMNWTLTEDRLVLEDSNRILQLDPENALAYLLRGSSNQYLGDRLTPPADFTHATLIEPQNPDIYAIIGSTYVQTGDTMDAVMYLDRALELDPRNARSYYFRGVVSMDESNYSAAIADFSRAIEVDPAYLDPYYDRGLTYVRQGDYSQAISDFNQALAINADFRLAYLSRGGVYQLSGDFQAAARDFMEYVRRNQSQQIAGQPLLPNVPVTLQMNTGLVYTLPLDVQPGQTITITASSPQDRADPLIVLVNADNQAALVGNDDEVIGRYTAAIHNFSISEPGRYTLLVTHSDGGVQGTVDVSLTVQ